jgi:hypothetical protein
MGNGASGLGGMPPGMGGEKNGEKKQVRYPYSARW